uniref:Cytochrome c domain-containing protein n=1 Tax=Lygus hesperus TaxID=30085 RepID=A0A0K8TIP5_LYGHE
MGDAERGKKVYIQKCQVCHNHDSKKHKVGPHQVGIFGGKAGTAEGFAYSDAMKKSGIVWNEATLDAYLADPKKNIPGNKMVFVGLKKAEERADVIAFLKTI